MRCEEPEGTVIRHVKIPELTRAKLEFYYEKLKEFDVLFNDELPNDFVSFTSRFLSGDAKKKIRPRGLIFEVDDVGILWMTMQGERRALAHFTFWDRRLRGRLELIKQMIEYVFERFELERLEVRVGLHAKPLLYFIEKLGFKKEGRLRKTSKYKGKLFDTNVYSLLKEEVNGSDTDRA